MLCDNSTFAALIGFPTQAGDFLLEEEDRFVIGIATSKITTLPRLGTAPYSPFCIASTDTILVLCLTGLELDDEVTF
jgi:hypothetical protein